MGYFFKFAINSNKCWVFHSWNIKLKNFNKHTDNIVATSVFITEKQNSLLKHDSHSTNSSKTFYHVVNFIKIFHSVQCRCQNLTYFDDVNKSAKHRIDNWEVSVKLCLEFVCSVLLFFLERKTSCIYSVSCFYASSW